MVLDFSSPPSLRPLLRDDVLKWANRLASGIGGFSEAKQEGLRLLEGWGNLSISEQEVVGEIMAGIFRVEDLQEPAENVQRIALQVVMTAPTILDELASPGAVPSLLDPVLLHAMALFAFSPEFIDVPQLEVVLNTYSEGKAGAEFPFNRALAEAGNQILRSVSSGASAFLDAKWGMSVALSFVHPKLVKHAAPARSMT